MYRIVLECKRNVKSMSSPCHVMSCNTEELLEDGICSAEPPGPATLEQMQAWPLHFERVCIEHFKPEISESRTKKFVLTSKWAGIGTEWLASKVAAIV